MRIGNNPNKDKISEPNEFFHQVVVPVYIPNQENYFKDSFQILKLCFESLFKTSHKKTFFTIVNNGSCNEVVIYLNKLHQENKIQELIHTTNVGKLNSILKGLTGNNFCLTTISDSDVMFLNNWQNETYTIFNNFKKAGVVSPTPSPKVYKYLTYNIIFLNLFSNKLAFTETKNPEALKKFANSVGNKNFYNENHFKKNLTISNKNSTAVIGAGHFVATYKSSIFDKLNLKFTNFNLGGDSEHLILDKPPVDQGLWRLATEENFAYHMGNTLEPWMFETLNSIKDTDDEIQFNDKKRDIYLQQSIYLSRIIEKLINSNFFWHWFLKFKGLTKSEIKGY